MKILSVRGENLASLPRFSLDLQDGPLAETGIFVITGPTGAGKSTLLDAICLALYDNTPRLVRVGPQSIVRQSAVEAFAEVDFVCGQGRKWRATWHVQRARKKPGGQWQDQTLRLTDLESGKLVSDHRKMDTLRRIEELVGLSFSQFCRSVLLAQGDFALFLQAKGDERAKLLEKITGTEIYAQLSAAAFRRSKEEVEALEALRTEAARYKGLEPAERERLCAERERLTARRQILVEQVERDKRLCAYYETAAQLRAELAAAAADLAEAERRSEEAEGLRRELRCYEAARALEPALQALDQAEAALRDAEAELTGATARAEGGAGRCAEAEAALAGAEQAALAARAEAASRAEELALARELDLRLRGADGRLAETRAQLAAAAAEEAQRRRGAEELARRLRQAGARREQVERWLGERPGLRALCEGWSGWQAVLDGLCEAHGRLRALSAERAGLEERHGQLRLAYHEVQERHGLALAARQGRREELAEAQARRAAHREAHPPAQREERGARLLALGAELREAAAGLAEAARLDREAREQERLAQGEAAAEQACLARAAAAAAALPAAREAVGAIEEELRLLRATQQLAARRPELLVAGRPCPLCGSTEHPAAAAAGSASALAPLGSIDEEVARRAAEHEAGRARLQALGVEEAAAQREAQGHRALRQRAEAAALGARAALAQRFDLQGQQGQQGSLRPLLQALQLGEAPAAEAMAGWLAQAAAEVERRGREVEAERLALEQVGREDAALQANVERRQEAEARASAEVERLALSLGQAEAVRAEAERALLLHEEREAQARAALAAAMRELVPLLDGLEGEGGPGHAQAALARDPAAVRERLRGLVREWQGRRREQDGIAEEVRALEGQQAAALGAAAQAEAARLSRQREEEGCAAEVARLTRERAGVLGGQPVADWERRLQGAVAQAEDAVARARAVREAAAREQAAAQEAATAAARRLQGAVTALEAARAALEAARVRAGDPVQGMALPEVRRWLGLGEEFRRRRAEEIEKRRDELVQRRAAHADRERRLAEHLQRAAAEGVAAEEGGEELAAAALRRSQGELDEVNGARFEVELQLSQDEQTAAHRQGILGEIRKREREADAWGRLNELIGSADGKKFRQFAQSMTLDTLLWHSNGHLRQLRPRYRIEREPGAGGDMELRVVDQDMGDEVRGCATLSGGEAFLVSLALALGLSSLSARDVKVESLFIDEGFGTLDRDTLEVAISTLEQLQSDGRQVGLISHVADLADRIGYQVLVEPRGVGCSQVTVPEARGR